MQLKGFEYLPLADLVVRNILLAAAFETEIIYLTALGMLGGSTCHAFAPHSKGGGQGMRAHEINQLSFCKSKL